MSPAFGEPKLPHDTRPRASADGSGSLQRTREGENSHIPTEVVAGLAATGPGPAKLGPVPMVVDTQLADPSMVLPLAAVAPCRRCLRASLTAVR